MKFAINIPTDTDRSSHCLLILMLGVFWRYVYPLSEPHRMVWKPLSALLCHVQPSAQSGCTYILSHHMNGFSHTCDFKCRLLVVFLHSCAVKLTVGFLKSGSHLFFKREGNFQLYQKGNGGLCSDVLYLISSSNAMFSFFIWLG